MPAIKTKNIRILHALSLKASNLYLAIGKTETEWVDVNNIPTPNPDQDIEELALIKKFLIKRLLVPDNEGSYIINNNRYKEIDEASAYQYTNVYLLLETTILTSEISHTIPFRQYAIIKDPIINGNVATGLIYTEIDSPGEILVIYNVQANYGTSNTFRKIMLLLEV